MYYSIHDVKNASHSLNIKTNVVYIMLFWILFFHSNEFALIVI